MLATPPLSNLRYELLPFAGAEPEAAASAEPLTLTVTCSPRQGLDNSLEVACRLRRLGHTIVLHLAARMLRGPEHLDNLLEQMAAAGIADVFLIGGDATDAIGPYQSALDLIGELRAHPRAPRSIGLPGYPEGHPLIDDERLAEALAEKAPQADYLTTQICFDSQAVARWLAAVREAGIELPAYVGVPGVVNRRRLLEISARVGVGASISYLRKQHDFRRMLGRPLEVTERLTNATLRLADTDLGIAGPHFFTFNRLVDTKRFVDKAVHPPFGEVSAGPTTTHGHCAIQ